MSKNPTFSFSREEMIKMFGLGAGAWIVAACSPNNLENVTLEPLKHNLELTPTDPVAAITEIPVNKVFSQEQLPDGFLPARLTPIENFYVQNSNGVAKPDEFSWKLGITGLLSQPSELSLLQILQRPSIKRMQTLECIGNPVGGNLIGNTNWTGISLRDLLKDLGIFEEAKFIHFYADDDYQTSITVDLALDNRSLLVFDMSDEELSAAHGSPIRVLLPGVYGQKQPKWINSIHVSKTDKIGSWEKKGWSNVAEININAKIETPKTQQYIPSEKPFYITGWSMAGNSGVSKVEVSIDNGDTWETATLLPGPHNNVWTLWYWVWESPLVGDHTLHIKATDGLGKSQSESGLAGILENVFPNGSSLMHKVSVHVIEN